MLHGQQNIKTVWLCWLGTLRNCTADCCCGWREISVADVNKQWMQIPKLRVRIFFVLFSYALLRTCKGHYPSHLLLAKGTTPHTYCLPHTPVQSTHSHRPRLLFNWSVQMMDGAAALISSS